MALTTKRRNALVKRYHSLDRRGSEIDYEKAGLLAELRAEFPSGRNGDEQFNAWAREWLDANGPNSVRYMLRMVDGYKAYDKKTWIAVKGWEGIRALLNYNKRSASRIMDDLREHIEKRGTVSHLTIHKHARDLGFARKKGLRISSTVEAMSRLKALSEFLTELYDCYELLPPVPDEVKAAMLAVDVRRISG